MSHETLLPCETCGRTICCCVKDGVGVVRSCCLMRHRAGAECPDGLVMCCLCFTRVPKDALNTLPDGTREDVCSPCAAAEAAATDAPETNRD